MKASIIGSGVVGESTGISLKARGNDVIFYDVDDTKLDKLKAKGCLTSSRIEEAVASSELIFICVPTPTVDDRIDLSCIDDAVAHVGDALKRVARYSVVVIRSTVVPSTTRCHVIPILQKRSGLTPSKDFGVCMNPEFLREKHASEDSMNPSRIIVGELDARSGDLLVRAYASFKAPIIRMDLDTAEMVKYTSNLFLASKISFFNEIYLICQKLGLDADTVSKGVSLDPRIGEYGVYGGKPFDGKCLPKDLKAFRGFVKTLPVKAKLLEAISSVNEEVARCVSKKAKIEKEKRNNELN